MTKNYLPIISIAIITYNQVDFLEALLNSILSQITEFKYEILICDDASSDGTEKLSLKYKAKFKSIIKYLRHQKNLGITANSNQGVRHAKGKYFCLVGGDDLFLPNKIQLQTKFMEDNPNVTLSYHPVDMFDSLTDKTIFITNQTRSDTPKNFFDLIMSPIPGSSSVMVRRSCIPKEGFNKKFPTQSEWLFFIQIAAKGDIGFLNKTLLRYRKHGNQESFRAETLINETLMSLDLAAAKLKYIPNVHKAVNIGKARYIAGEAYRQLTKGNSFLTRKLLTQALKNDRRLIYLFGIFVSFIPLPNNFYSRLRFFFKKIY
jgi:glycosyltransferase involved in cell wall biosynthesis